MANPLLTDEQNRRLANQNSTYNQIMQGFTPVQQPQEDSWLGGLSRGAKAGLGGVGAGLLHAGQAAFGTDGSLAAEFDAMAENNAQRREWDLADTLSLDYLTNPEGLAYGIGQIAGSMALPALFGAGVAAAVPTGGTSLLGTGALIGAAGAAPMAISEGGNTYAQGLQQGMTEDEAKKAGLTDAAIKLPFYMLSEGLSGKVAQGLISKGLLNAEGKSLGRRAAESGAKILGNAANEAYEEGTENRSSAYALGDQRISGFGNILNPFDWNEEDKAQAVGVFTPTLALGTLTGSAGHLRSRFGKKNSDISEEIASEDGGTIEEAPEATVSGKEAFINAIAGQESGGNYNAENGRTGAYGKYQIIPSNWPEWAEEAGIGANAPRTPENQEIVARFKLGQYFDKYGAEGAAVAWYSGEGNAERWVNGETTDIWGQPWDAPQHGNEPSIAEYATSVAGRIGNVADSVRIDDTEENYFDESNYTDDTIPDSLNPVRGFDVSHLDKGTAQDRNSLLYGERVKKQKPAPTSEEVASFNQSLDNSNAQKAPNSLFVNSPRSWDAAERIYKARAKEQAERKARAQAIVNIANAQQQSFLNVLRNRATQQWDNAEQEYKDRKQDKLQSLANVINARAAQKWDAKEADNAQKAKAEQEKQAQLQNIARLLDARAAQQWDNAERDANLRQNQAQALANLLNAKAAGQYDVAQQVYANRAKEQAEKQRQQQAIANIINARAAQKFDEAETADKFKFVPQRQSMYDGAMRRNLAAHDKVKAEEQPSVEPTGRNGVALDKRNMLDVTLPKVREQHKWDKEHKEYHAERYGESALPQTQLLSTDRAARRNMPKPGIEARSFINDRAEKKSARERMQDAIAFVWKDDPKHPLKSCRRQLNMFRDMRKEYLQPIYDVMAEGAGNGVSRIPIIEFDNQHRGRFYRQSNNSPWYAKYFKEHKKKPTQKAMYDIAEEVAFGENADVGYYAGVQGKELEAIVAENHEQLDPINDYIQTYESLELRLKENPNYGKEQAERINKAEEERRAEKRNAGETASTESIQTEAKQPAESNQDEVNKKAPALAEGYTTESGRSLDEADENEFILHKGEKNFGEITKAVADVTDGALKAAPIRLQVGNAEFGLKHLLKHEAQMQSKGFNDVYEFIDHVLKNFNQVYSQQTEKKPNRFVLYCKDDKSKGFMPIDLELKKDTDGYYTIVSAMPHKAKIKGTLVYDGSSRPSTATTDSLLSSDTNGKGGDDAEIVLAKPNVPLSTQSVAQPAENVKKINLPKGTTADVSIVGDNSNIIQVKFNGEQGKGTSGIMGRAGYKWKSDKQLWQARKTEKAMDVAEQLGYTEEVSEEKNQQNQGKQEYKYYLNARPADVGAVPKGFIRVDTEDKGGRYGAIYYDRQLSDKEVQQYELKSDADISKEKAQTEAVKEVSRELLKSDKVAMQAKNNTFEDFTLAYYDDIENYLADHIEENPVYADLLNDPVIIDKAIESESIIKNTYEKLRGKSSSEETTDKLSKNNKTADKQEAKQQKSNYDYGDKNAILKDLLAATGLKEKNSKVEDVEGLDYSDAGLEEALNELAKECSKLSANPMFNPALYRAAAKVGLIFLKRTGRNFKRWAKALLDWFRKNRPEEENKIKPFLGAIYKNIENWPKNLAFKEDIVELSCRLVGSSYAEGNTSFEAVYRDIVDMAGEENAQALRGYLEQAYLAVDELENPTLTLDENVVESKQDKGGSQYDSNSTESLFSDDTGFGNAGNEIRTTSKGKEPRGSNGQGSKTSERESERNGNSGVHGSRTSAGGKTSVREGSQEASSTDGDASGSTGLSNSVVDSLQEQPNVNEGAVENIVESASDGRVNATDEVTQKVNEVIKENNLDKRRADRLQQTAKVMPFLTAIQLHNTDFVAERFDTNGKQGVMITDGTGTGKTFSGLAIVKNMVGEGKKNIIIAAPNDTIINQWIESARDFYNLEVTRLKDTDDAGEGIVITTYANFGENEELVNRNWDMVICDESHNLMNSESGKTTNILSRLRLLTYHPTELRNRAEQTILSEDKIEARKIVRKALALKTKEPESLSAKERSIISASERIQANSEDKLTKEETAQIEAQAKEWEELNESEKPKVMFLSATPFAYVNDIDYANGYLFDYPKLEGQGYNQPNGLQQFLMEHFGYRMRYNKLTKPDGSVDNALMEMEFHEWLRNTGALTGHELEIDKDYNRGFILVDQGVGRQIDEGFEFLRENKEKYGNLEAVLNKQFDGRRRNYLLESIKARASVPIIREYLKAGKKVVVFHETNVERESFNPFRFTKETIDWLAIGSENAQQIKHEWDLFAKERPDLVNLNLDELSEPRRIYEEAFGDEAMFFNGRVPKKKRAQYVAAFNNDNSGKNLIIVQQDAGNAGISLHDTTGKHPRVEVNINIPRRPSFMIQIDGRIYRLGCMSNAIIRYLTTGTNIENNLFASTVAGRTSTAENLALGRKARGLRDSIIGSYQKTLDGTWVENLPGAEGEDVGGKESDRNMITSASDYDRAKGLYYGRGKKTAKNKAAEGVDYFATPEPIGYKMVQWANVKAGDKILEPSAGHGAISRFFSPTTENTIIEPSGRLAPQAQMNTENAKLINGVFEDLHISNKYDAITMNPPFGTGGKTAIEHLSKAFGHLREGGRVIALIPRGGMADKRFTKWYESDEAKNAHMVGEVLLPNVTFERAGTKVATRIVIIDKGGESQGVKRVDLSRINNINELFDNLESVEMPARQTKQTDVGAANFANSLRKGDAEGNSEVVTADSYKHTKTGAIIPSAKLNANLSDEEYRKVKSIAGKNGGYYSRYAKAFLFQDNENGRDKFVEEVNGANNTQYSVSSEAVQRAKEEVEAEIRAAFPNGKVEYVNGVPTITMPNGSKFQYSIRENIIVNAKEQRKADAAHGTSGARVQGFWKKFTGNGVQRMLAVSQNSERGTAFHEAMHAAIDLVLTEKEKNALYNYYEKKAKEQNRDVDEIIADAYRDWVLARQRKSGTMFGKLWQKVKDFCTRVKAIFDKGAEVERIMQDVESGRVYKRGTNNHSVTKRISFSKEEIQGQKGSGTTQVATTRTMYVKALKWLRNQSPEAKTVLDYGAGLGLGTDDMRSNNPDLNIDCYEPNPERWAGKQPPTYTNNTQINKDYDLILNTNVLNVVEKPIRDLIVKDIADHLNMGGKALITTRGWSNDVNAAKNFKPADEHHAIWINKGKNGYVFQKGFDGDELKNYIQELLGDEFVVEKTRPTFGKSSVTITRVKSSSEETHYSVASPKHKIANAFTNTERKGTIETAKDFIKEQKKNWYTDLIDKNHILKSFDQLTKTGLSVYDQVQNLPSTTAGMLKAICEGTALSIKAANQHLKNVKMKYNVTLAMALAQIDKKIMDKAQPKYLAANGFDSWVNAFGAYLGAERLLEMNDLAKAEGKVYKFPKGLTEAELRAFTRNAPEQFRKAADMFYKVNDNMISVMEDAQVFSHDLAQQLRTKYKKYCPLLRDFSDTAAADTFINGLTEGGRGIGNVSVPLKKINIEGSERGVLNPLESVLKSYSVMLNRAERNKVGLMAVNAAKTAQLHDLIKEVPEVKGKDGKVVNAVADPKNCIFTVLVNGKKKAYQTTQELYSPIVGYNLPAAGLCINVARMAAHMLRTGATMSPSFIVRNFLRDTVFASISSKNGFIPFVDSIRGAIALWNDPAMRAEFEAAGVTEFNFYGSQNARIKSIDAMAGEKPVGMWQMAKWVFTHMEAASDFVESSTRMGEFMKAKEKGLSMEEAARAAREVTLDFSRSGVIGEQINRYVPFFNACLQGGDKMARLFHEDFVGTSLKVFKYIMLPSLLIMAMNWDEDWYKDLDPDIKNNYWCLGRNIRIPKPQEAGVLFGSGIEALFQQAAGKDKEAVENCLKAFLSNMIPGIVPTLFLPILEWQANYSYFKGRQLVGSKYQRLPDELQYNDYTSELSKGIGSVLKVSPMKIDNLVRGYTGTMGALLWSMAGEPFAKANNLPAKHFNEMLFVRDFNVTDANLSRPMNEFYGILDKANRQHAGYGVKGKPEAAVKGIRSAGSMISKIRKDIDKITYSNLTPERKRELIDKRKEKMNQIAKQANARYGKYFD